MACYSGTPLARKLGIKLEARVAFALRLVIRVRDR